jgi:hypothetical protein
MDSLYCDLTYNAATDCSDEIRLIYRGVSFPYSPPTPKPYRKPRAVNWRYQIPGETCAAPEAPIVLSYRKPRAVNWRYQ